MLTTYPQELSLSHDRPHEPDTSRGNGAGEPPRGRPDEHDPQTPTDSTTANTNQRDDDRGIGAEDSALRATRDELDSVDEALEAEIVDDPPKQRLRSVVSEWSGNLPHPDDAERYEQLSPGTLDRLIALNERRMSVVEREVQISEKRADTVHNAVDAESDVKRSLADADSSALRRGQWLSWSISLVSLIAVMLGLALGYPQALWGIVVPIVQAGASLVRTVTQAQSDGDDDFDSRSNGQNSE